MTLLPESRALPEMVSRVPPEAGPRLGLTRSNVGVYGRRRPKGRGGGGGQAARYRQEAMGCNNTGVACHALLQGIFPIQGSNPGFLHCRHRVERVLVSQDHFSAPEIISLGLLLIHTSSPASWLTG